MEWPRTWRILRGRLMMLIGIFALFMATFGTSEGSAWTSLLVLIGVGLILLSVPPRIWRGLPAWFRRDDSWL